MQFTEDDATLTLAFGYRPQIDTRLLQQIASRGAEAPTPASFEEAVTVGSRIINEVMDDRCTDVHGVQVVPLSGGMDSRFLLGHLVERLGPGAVRTVTLGMPGAFDFEFGQRIARKAGVPNTPIDLRRTEWTIEGAIDFALKAGNPVPVIDGYLYHQSRLPHGEDCTYWSGFLGGVVAGSHLGNNTTRSWESAVDHFGRSQASRAVAVPDWEHVWRRIAPDTPLVDDIHPVEQLDYAVRQSSFIVPTVLTPGYRYETPLADSRWAGFLLAQPEQWRRRSLLYRSIIASQFPVLASMPYKGHMGAPLLASDRRVFAAKLLHHGFDRLSRAAGRERWTLRHRKENYLLSDVEYARDTAFRDAVDRLVNRASALDVVARALEHSEGLSPRQMITVNVRLATIGAFMEDKR